MNNKSTIVKAIATDGSILVQAIDSTAVVSEMERNHKTSAVNTAALGRLITATSMMGTTLKNEKDSITIRVDGHGPAGTLIAVSDTTGNVKGYITNPVVEIPLNEENKLDVSGSVGKNGELTVIKDLGLKEPQTGQVSLASGEIAEDITYYYAMSEQIPTACGLGVLVNTDLTVKAAGGFLAQILPGGDDDSITALEDNLSKMGDISTMIEHGVTAQEICELLLDGMDPQIISTREVEYKCDCSQERVDRALISIGKEELEKIIADDEKTEVTCDFCDKVYNYSKEDLINLVNRAKK